VLTPHLILQILYSIDGALVSDEGDCRDGLIYQGFRVLSDDTPPSGQTVTKPSQPG